MSLKYSIIEPNNEINELLYKYCSDKNKKIYIEIGEEKYFFLQLYLSISDEVENFEVRNSDIWLTSHPKAGTTWMQEMIWMIVNNLDFEGSKEDILERVPFFELKGARYNKKISHHTNEDSIEKCRKYPKTPRLFKTHLPFDLLPKQIRNKTKKPKIIHVARNPKDVCVSYYHHYKLFMGFKGSFEDYCKLFLNGRTLWGPFWENTLSYWNRKDECDILFIKYEDMKKDLRSVILQVAKYLDKTLTEEQLNILADHLSFEKMKQNKSVNMEELTNTLKNIHKVEGNFMRSGTVGSYKTEMSEEIIQEFNKWNEKKSAGTGLDFNVVLRYYVILLR